MWSILQGNWDWQIEIPPEKPKGPALGWMSREKAENMFVCCLVNMWMLRIRAWGGGLVY